ncbi:Ca-activated chloride channel homolog [Bathymodiolus platifrons methanotrophic gill symbiont]|uniref:vWA domain-containing protein n=1 Tax=Bathymodiolus platifrons methanotrophic gill symbiont TaxID=113268 RepID=UPI000B4113A3|nr:VWA domain-containing protein [Bathymodiolus platifrons methanotrophic gill symbiont]MCK5870868.1 VWA domain-containing protein [Methyloprofundus sp.]TXL00410.1 VWA domain-containing protein [Methylococcaceae bacterium CS5]TXL03585.1 VWA domain-containing protein [Methylococcaceae bacterium CS3]TXL08043.1 VWA domain-containing protein [Methylococcaceae bacterium CS1]TXL10749.1 VWA domain-containing protein [Methylococcaceae bacterium CS2]TXL20984.1 VWA domain-containing protein [Methylococ
MIHFAWPWLWLILPLPWFIRRFFPAANTAEQAALKVPFLEDFGVAQSQQTTLSNKPWLLWLAIAAWCLLILASTRPQWLGDPIEQGVSGRDLMLAVDLSGSMKERDFIVNNQAVDRLTATKTVANEFIERRVGDRLGLILFGTNAYLQTPLTFDRKTVQILLNESALGLAGENTAIGDAIGLAVKRLQSQTDSRVLILLTDGANTAGEVSPIKAAEIAAQHHLKIYTIGIGADEMIVRSFFGSQRVNPSRDLDEKTLTVIAEKTGGRYFRARNTDELKQIYHLLDELEPVEKDKQFFRPRSELFFWPLSIALLLVSIISFTRIRLT